MSKIPEGWIKESIGSVGERFVGGGTPSRDVKDYYNGNIPWLTVKDLNEKDFYKGNAEEKVTLKAIKESSSNLIDEGNIIVSTRMGLGRGIINTCPMAINQDMRAIYLKKSKVSNEYFLQWYKGNSEKVEALGSGSTVKGITLDLLKGIEIPLPPINEQKKIAEILTSVDKVIELTEIEIEKLKNLKKGMMQDLLTKGIGHTKFKDSPIGKIPESWEVKTLDELKLDKNGIVDGPFGSNLKTEHYRTEGIPIMQSGFVTSNRFFAKKYLYVDQNKFDEQKRSAIQGGDILMAKIGANCGTCAIVPKSHPVSILAGNSMKLTFNPKKILNEYVLFNLHLWGEIGSLDRIKTETAQPALNITSLKKAKIAVPNIEEQQKIINLINTIDKNIILKIKRYEQIAQLKKGLMQDLLTGKVRVKV